MTAVFLILFLAGCFLLGYMYYRAHNDQLEEQVLESPKLDRGESLHIFFISDVHNREIATSTLRKLKQVDVVIIGGDLVDKRTSMERLEKNLKRLTQWSVPVYFIPGNNDHELQSKDLVNVLNQYQVRTLSNEDEKVKLDHGIEFVLTGLDPYFLKQRRSSSLMEDEGFRILCVHDPYVFKQMNPANKNRSELVLSGHTHGGQIRLFGLGPYERGGWSQYNKQALLISEGYGTSLIPLRLGTKAECHWIQILPLES
ncbi:metallophosphoesterase [Halobacillus litoralis]|uniref:metallophosphoesterase n=1 Tax=Halobacillus litoralis TaxID=45668 RepID=UPI001CFD1DF8|nr:metallophosphoesterase [Halobacillus litoralis]